MDNLKPEKRPPSQKSSSPEGTFSVPVGKARLRGICRDPGGGGAPRQRDRGEDAAWAPCSLLGEFHGGLIRTPRSGQAGTEPGAPAARLWPCPSPSPRSPGSAEVALQVSTDESQGTQQRSLRAPPPRLRKQLGKRGTERGDAAFGAQDALGVVECQPRSSLTRGTARTPPDWALQRPAAVTPPGSLACLSSGSRGRGCQGTGQVLGQLEAGGKGPGRPLRLQVSSLQDWES